MPMVQRGIHLPKEKGMAATMEERGPIPDMWTVISGGR